MTTVEVRGGIMKDVDVRSITVPRDRWRPINDVAVKTLADSFQEVGQLQAIVIDPQYRLIAGAHRLAAAKMLGWSKIAVRIVKLDELRSELAEIDENLITKDLTTLERGQHLKRRKEIYDVIHPETKNVNIRGGPGRGRKKTALPGSAVSFVKDAAKKTGRAESTVRRDVQIAETLSKAIQKALANTTVADSPKDLLAIAKAEPEEQKAIVKKIASGEADSVKEARTILKREEQDEIPKDLPKASERYTLFTCDCSDAAIAPKSVDVIITDPPYPREFLKAFEKLSAVAARVLKPGGSCVVMSGQAHLPDVIERLCKHLTYQWTLAYLTPGGQSVQLHDRKVNTFWKPLLWFVKGEYEGKWKGDVIKSDVNDNDKRFHHWGQSESGMARIVEAFSKPGEIVFDPFCGGGTTGVVSLALNRTFIGCDIDERAIRVSSARLLAVAS